MNEQTQAAGDISAAQQAAEARLAALGAIQYAFPGRVRLRLRKELRSRELMDALLHRLLQIQSVRRVKANHTTWGITIEFDRDLTLDDVVAPLITDPAVSERAAAERLRVLGTIEERAPGRIRLRLKPALRTPDLMQTVEQMIETNPLVESVTVDDQAGLIVIEFTNSEAARELSRSALAEAELVAATLFDLPGEDGGGYGKLDQQLANALYRVDRAVYRKTGLRFRGQILAGAIAGLGLAQIAIYGISLEMLPGPLLLWIAWDIYHRMAQQPPLEAEEEALSLRSP